MKNKFTQQLPAFIVFGIALALLMGLFVVFAYVIFWGIVLGAVLWVCVLIASYFQKTDTPSKKGRIIDYDEFK